MGGEGYKNSLFPFNFTKRLGGCFAELYFLWFLQNQIQWLGKLLCCNLNYLSGTLRFLCLPFIAEVCFLLPMFFICRSDKPESFCIRNSPSWSHCMVPHEVIVLWNRERIQIFGTKLWNIIHTKIPLLLIFIMRKFSNSTYQISPQVQGIRNHNKLLDKKGWMDLFF